MPTPLLVAFDLDDTLAPSKQALPARIGQQLLALAEHVEVAVISGGQWKQFQSQFIANLPAPTQAHLDRIHLMPTCGTQYFRHDGATFTAVYSEPLSEDEKARAIAALEASARQLELWCDSPAGDVIEDRDSQITFSALGQEATLGDKIAWDPTGERKRTLRDAVALAIPDLEVRSGGSTSIDITRKGVDKAYGMQRLSEASGVSYTDMLFFGDRLDEGGNDYPVLSLGVPSVAVHGWEDTAEHLDALIASLREHAA